MKDSKTDQHQSNTEAEQDIVATPVLSRRASLIRVTLAGLLTLIVIPYFWARAIVIFMMMYFRLSNVPWLAALVLLIIAVAALMYRLDSKGRIKPFRWTTVFVLSLIWSGSGLAILLLGTSPFVNRLLFAPIYVLSSLWIFWLWIMPMTPLTHSSRSKIFILLLFFIILYPLLITFDGVDGDSRPIHSWRFSALDSPSITDRTQSETPSSTDQLETSEIPSFPQFLGPDRNGIVTSKYLSQNIKEHRPQEIWRQDIGLGWGGFAVQGNQAITQEQRGTKEMVVCYDILSGDQVWIHDDEVIFKSGASGDGPRATPTIANGRVYTLGATGQLNCLELNTGQQIWSINILEDNDTENLFYGISSSPLVVDQLVIVCPGGKNGNSLVAYNKDTGRRIWHSENDGGGYGSPTLMSIADTRQILMYNASAVTAHQPETGTVLWSHPWQNNRETNCTQPVQINRGGNRILISTGYGLGSCLIELSKSDDNLFTVKQLWKSKALRAKFSSIVVKDEYAYGLDNGTLVCIDLANGTQKWKGNRYGHGQVLLANDILIIQAEKGKVFFVQATPESFSQLYSMEALNAKTWNNPALAGRFLLVRNSWQAICYELTNGQ